ncbi:hypothetical protein ACKGJY_11495 [Hyunsoonleella sp. 2307UL5-6]|uniref:hypothetical protein n=1 Tax=Hyunsoonleella sp. 2307UL5-6 TaxID=3384768 RepID=UPI0039BD2CF5
MKKSVFKLCIAPLCLLLCSTQCEDDIPSINQDTQAQELTILKTDIETIAGASICNTTFECKFIAFGSKPCGGPWRYLIYSTSIDIETLESMVENYNQMEAEYNEAFGIASNCAIENPPTSINCENNECVAVY